MCVCEACQKPPSITSFAQGRAGGRRPIPIHAPRCKVQGRGRRSGCLRLAFARPRDGSVQPADPGLDSVPRLDLLLLVREAGNEKRKEPLQTTWILCFPLRKSFPRPGRVIPHLSPESVEYWGTLHPRNRLCFLGTRAMGLSLRKTTDLGLASARVPRRRSSSWQQNGDRSNSLAHVLLFRWTPGIPLCRDGLRCKHRVARLRTKPAAKVPAGGRPNALRL